MSNYIVNGVNGKFHIARGDRNDLELFCGYDFMGSADWSRSWTKAEAFDTREEAKQVIEDLEAADEPTEPTALEIVLQAAQDRLDSLNAHGCVDKDLEDAIRTLTETLEGTKVHYRASGIHGWGLEANPDEVTSLEGIRTAIDRAGEYQRANDNQVEQYIIYRVETGTKLDSDRKLVSRSTIETRVELYPAEITGDPYYMVVNDQKQIRNICGSYDVVKMVSVCEKNPGSYVKNTNTGETVYRSSKH